jgi:arginase family enzyme
MSPTPETATADAAIVGMPYDGLATFRGGATRRGPQEIRKFSLLFGGYNFDWDLDVFEHLRVVDVGDVDVVPGDNARSYRRFEDTLEALLRRGIVPLSLGGDHGITFPAVKAVAAITAHRSGWWFSTPTSISARRSAATA